MQPTDIVDLYPEFNTTYHEPQPLQVALGKMYFWLAEVRKTLGPDTLAKVNALSAKVDTLTGQLSDDEANILAALRSDTEAEAEIIAQHLAPLLPKVVGRIPDDQFAALVQAVSDESDRRAAARANTPVPPA